MIEQQGARFKPTGDTELLKVRLKSQEQGCMDLHLRGLERSLSGSDSTSAYGSGGLANRFPVVFSKAVGLE